MAVRPVTRTWTFTALGTVSLATLLSKPTNYWIYSVAVRAARTNVDDVEWTDAQGAVGGFIGPGESVTMDFGHDQSLIGNFTFLGVTDDIIYVTVGMNSDYFLSTDQ